MTLDALIERLTAIRDDHGGELPVVVNDEELETEVSPAMVRFGFAEDGNEALLIDTME